MQNTVRTIITKRLLRANDIAIQALERQVAKPPEHKVHEKYKSLGKNYYCQCGVMFVDFERNGTNFCGNCGQRLKEDCNAKMDNYPFYDK